MNIEKGLTLKLLTTGQDVLPKLRRRCVMTACKRIKPLQLRQQDLEKVNLNLELDDNKVAIDCILKAIGQHQESMPYSLEQIYKEIKNQLEAKKAGF